MRRLLVAAALALTLACSVGDAGTNANNTAIAGTYALQTINGSGLPFTFVSGTDSLTVSTDTIAVAADGSWAESYAYRQTVSGQVTTGTQVDGGLWVTDGNQIEFDSTLSGLVVYTGTFTASMLSLTDGNSTQIFAR
jgi:hypothetical protein